MAERALTSPGACAGPPSHGISPRRGPYVEDPFPWERLKSLPLSVSPSPSTPLPRIYLVLGHIVTYIPPINVNPCKTQPPGSCLDTVLHASQQSIPSSLYTVSFSFERQHKSYTKSHKTSEEGTCVHNTQQPHARLPQQPLLTFSRLPQLLPHLSPAASSLFHLLTPSRWTFLASSCISLHFLLFPALIKPASLSDCFCPASLSQPCTRAQGST